MNKKIVALALPNMISNITVPLLGMVDMAMAGRIAGGEQAIGAIAIGATIFNFIYWNCAFLRMGSSGLVAQAYGARNLGECANLLVRGLLVAIGLATLLLIGRGYVGNFSFAIMQGSPDIEALARSYFSIRIWAAPATISLYALHGWFVGMQNSRTPMWCAIVMNIVNIVVGITLVLGLDMGIAGIAWATVAAQYAGLLFTLVVWGSYYRRLWGYIEWGECVTAGALLRFFHVNKDIFLRTACIVTVFTFFTSASSAMGDTTLAINSLLMQLFTLYSYMSDGVAYAAESLVGRYLGAKNQRALRDCIEKLFYWAVGFSFLYVGVYATAWHPILSMFTDSEAILEGARPYIAWVVLIPLVGSIAFLMDGIMIGATLTRIMRNTMFVSMLIFFATYYTALPLWGNTAIWLALVVFLSARGATLLIATKRLRILFA